MHYANGREAKVGDLVRGKGYNFKHEIIGIVVEAQPGLATCNCVVACVGVDGHAFIPRIPARLENGKWVAIEGLKPEIQASYEYGQLDAFVALDPATGDVLPPVVSGDAAQ
jgi:hypothetical protein